MSEDRKILTHTLANLGDHPFSENLVEDIKWFQEKIDNWQKEGKFSNIRVAEEYQGYGDCSPTWLICGDREETDIEYYERLSQEAEALKKRIAAQEQRAKKRIEKEKKAIEEEKALLEKLKKKYEK